VGVRRTPRRPIFVELVFLFLVRLLKEFSSIIPPSFGAVIFSRGVQGGKFYGALPSIVLGSESDAAQRETFIPTATI
jgi:hypothetical protein